MRVSVTRTSDDGLMEREWIFVFYSDWGETYFRLEEFAQRERPSTRHKFRARLTWYRSGGHQSNMTVDDLYLPANIEPEARQKIIQEFTKTGLTIK